MAHGAKPLRGLESTAQSSTTTGKFGRMFRWLPKAYDAASDQEATEVAGMLQELAALMISTEFNDRVDKENEKTPDVDIGTAEPDDENRTIPAGYTYLAQFVDHDITFDPASSLQQENDPDALEDFRTPRLDLDCLYGRGPDDQPYLYAHPERRQFILGPDRGVSGMRRFDLQRTADNTALIGDKRNDENKIVSQIHALFLAFHNKVFTQLAVRYPGPAKQEARFLDAQRIVRWCYQWIVLKDLLPKVCRAGIVHDALHGDGRAPRLQFYSAHSGEAYIPVEFSVAAYRFGHSMVRPSYLLNEVARSTAKFRSKGGKTTDFARIPIFVAASQAATDAMNGFGERLPEAWGIDWRFFFGAMPEAKPGVKQVPQPSYRIDTTLVDPLGALPELVPQFPAGSPFASLAFRNLVRGFRMGLPSGQAVARFLGVKDVLTEEDLWRRKGKGVEVVAWPEGKAVYEKHKRWLAGRAPLWFYILKEAEVRERGQRLGEVGSRIVAETMVGLAWYDHFSYVFQNPRWTPADEGLAGLTDKLDMLALTQYVTA